jgi:hypothetical protein
VGRPGMKRVEVWVDQAEHDRVMADKPKGWLAEQVRQLFAAAAAAAGEVPVLDVGPEPKAVSNVKVVADEVPTHRHAAGQTFCRYGCKL